MGQLVDTRLRALDSSANPLSGAKLYIYNANTSTPTTLYSDAALSVPLSNPVTADSGGWFAQVYAAEGTVVDMTLKDSAGSTIKSYEDLTLVGSDTGDLTRTVSGNGRIKFTGSAGAVLVQAGDPSPDDTGGTLTIEGWAGTQLDSLTLDAATTNTTGRLKENSRAIGGVVTTGTATSFSAAANVDIALPEITDGVRAWKVTLFDLTASGATSIWIRFSYDGGGTYKSGAADYAYANFYNTTTTPTSATSTGAAQINVGNVLNGSKVGLFEMTVITVESGTNPTIVNGTLISYDATGSAPSVMDVGGYGLGSYGRATHMRITNAGGQTYTGKYRVEALYGFGEA